MIANLPVDVIVTVVPLPIVNGPVTEALLLAAIVTLPVVAFEFTRNKMRIENFQWCENCGNRGNRDIS